MMKSMEKWVQSHIFKRILSKAYTDDSHRKHAPSRWLQSFYETLHVTHLTCPSIHLILLTLCIPILYLLVVRIYSYSFMNGYHELIKMFRRRITYKDGLSTLELGQVLHHMVVSDSVFGLVKSLAHSWEIKRAVWSTIPFTSSILFRWGNENDHASITRPL